MFADVFENLRNKCVELYERDPAHFFDTWISMTSMFEKAEVKLELFTDINMLLMVEKGIRGGRCQAIHRHAIANNKYM